MWGRLTTMVDGDHLQSQRAGGHSGTSPHCSLKAGLTVPAYAIDDETAIKVADGTVEVISEGHWKLFVA